MTDTTALYWRKLLRVNEEVDPTFLRKFHSPLEFLRPAFYFILKVLLCTFCSIEAHGVENIPKKAPYIIAPNHVSVIDPGVVLTAMGKKRNEMYTLASKHFFDNPFACFFMRIGSNVMRLDREDDFLPALQSAVKVLKLGGSIYIHPEGTRSSTGELLPFKVGVGVLAVESGAPLVPVYIEGTFHIMRKGSLIPKPRKVKVYFGKPILMDEYKKKMDSNMAYDVYKEVTDELYARIKALKESA
jgi:long-chain acyl-CoA synthetase